MAGYEGFAALGEMLSGGGQSDGAAYADSFRQGSQARGAGYNADKAYEQARVAKLRANAVALASEALAAGDVAGYNARTALSLGDQLEPFSAVDGGKAVMRKDTGEISLTDIGNAAVQAENALAGSRANAGEAALIRANRPPAPKAAPKPSASGRATAVRQAQAAIASGADRAKVAARLAELGYPDAEGEL